MTKRGNEKEKLEYVIHVRVNEKMKRKLKKASEELGLYPSVLIRLAIAQFLKKKKTIEDISKLVAEVIGGEA